MPSNQPGPQQPQPPPGSPIKFPYRMTRLHKLSVPAHGSDHRQKLVPADPRLRVHLPVSQQVEGISLDLQDPVEDIAAPIPAVQHHVPRPGSTVIRDRYTVSR